MIQHFNSNKTTEPDGYSIAFSNLGGINKSDIMEVFQNQNFHACGKFEKSLNAAFISLITKIPSHCGCEGFLAHQFNRWSARLLPMSWPTD